MAVEIEFGVLGPLLVRREGLVLPGAEGEAAGGARGAALRGLPARAGSPDSPRRYGELCRRHRRE